MKNIPSCLQCDYFNNGQCLIHTIEIPIIVEYVICTGYKCADKDIPDGFVKTMNMLNSDTLYCYSDETQNYPEKIKKIKNIKGRIVSVLCLLHKYSCIIRILESDYSATFNENISVILEDTEWKAKVCEGNIVVSEDKHGPIQGSSKYIVIESENDPLGDWLKKFYNINIHENTEDKVRIPDVGMLAFLEKDSNTGIHTLLPDNYAYSVLRQVKPASNRNT